VLKNEIFLIRKLIKKSLYNTKNNGVQTALDPYTFPYFSLNFHITFINPMMSLFKEIDFSTSGKDILRNWNGIFIYSSFCQLHHFWGPVLDYIISVLWATRLRL
jgi:hypothetical protein